MSESELHTAHPEDAGAGRAEARGAEAGEVGPAGASAGAAGAAGAGLADVGAGSAGASALDARLARAREGLDRLSPQRLHELLGDAPGAGSGAGSGRAADVLVVDIRPEHNRAAEGEIPGSVPVERIVLEWRLDPFGGFRLPGFTAATRVVVVCNEGYASSLAARDLRELGLPLATDLAGGFRGYAAAGLPVRQGPTDAVR